MTKPSKAERDAIRREWTASERGPSAPPKPEAAVAVPEPAEDFVLTNSRGEVRRPSAAPAAPTAPPAVSPEERLRRRDARRARAATAFRPPLQLSGSFEESYGRSTMTQTERMSESGTDRHGSFVDAAIRAGMLTPKT